MCTTGMRTLGCLLFGETRTTICDDGLSASGYNAERASGVGPFLIMDYSVLFTGRDNFGYSCNTSEFYNRLFVLVDSETGACVDS